MGVVEGAPERRAGIFHRDQHRQLLGRGAIRDAAGGREQRLLQALELGRGLLARLTGGRRQPLERRLEGMTQDKRAHALLKERPLVEFHQNPSAMGNAGKISHFRGPCSHLFATAQYSFPIEPVIRRNIDRFRPKICSAV